MEKNTPKNINGKLSCLFAGFLSFIFMGLGQLRNKQWYKAVPLFLILIIYLAFEILTSRYSYALHGEMSKYPAAPGEKIYFIRDYGGFFTKGLWGLFTLGKFVLGDVYRGQKIIQRNLTVPWGSADRSIDLLGSGIIALVLLLILAALWIFSIADAYKTRKIYLETGKLETGKLYIKRIWDKFFAYIIVIPSILLLILFTLIPFLFSFSVAFTNFNWKVKTMSNLVKWVGFNTFVHNAFRPEWFHIFLQIFEWTVIWAVASSITCYLLGFFQAVVLESKYVKGRKVWRMMMILPWAIPSVISLMVFRNIFDTDGLVNKLLIATHTNTGLYNFLRLIGLLGQKKGGAILWFSDPGNANLAKVVIILVNLWLGAPYFMMLIIGVLNTISRDLYEAAEIDGATGFQKFRRITLPLVFRATIPVIIMTFTFNFNNFGAIYFLTGGAPKFPAKDIPPSMIFDGGTPQQTDILISWIYKLAFTNSKELYNIAAVYSILIFIVVGGFAIFNLARARRFWEDD